MAVSVPRNESYFLYVIPNPISACRVAMYKEHYVKTAAGWIPDRLQELHRLPDFGVMPDPDDGIPDQTTRAYLLDIWLTPNADVARFRIEVQLKMADWTVRPIEVRVMPARYADVPPGPDRPLPAVDMSAAASAVEALEIVPLTMPPAGLTTRGIIRRNAVQDVTLARDRTALASRALELFRANTMFTPPVWGAEWWLRLRDRLLARAE